MTDKDRFENIEDVRNLYREQGAQRERERIMKILEGFPIEVYRNGMIDEQERIIKLLEEEGERNYISEETFNYVVSIILLSRGNPNEN